MRGFSVVIGFFFLMFGNSCQRSYDTGYMTCTPVPVDQDSSALVKFAADNHIMTTKDPSGFYYEIIDSGAAPMPSSASTIYVTYVGKLMDGSTFDSSKNSDSTGWVLNTLLQGWYLALPKIGTGGHIKLLLPSALAFSCAGSGDGRVPSNAPVYYDINLVRFK